MSNFNRQIRRSVCHAMASRYQRGFRREGPGRVLGTGPSRREFFRDVWATSQAHTRARQVALARLRRQLAGALQDARDSLKAALAPR